MSKESIVVMSKLFDLKSKFKPAGDQSQAISKLKKGIERGDQYQTLLGVTGSGKTFTMANVIENFDMPVLVMAPNKALAAQLYSEYKKFFPNNSVNYFVSYYDYYQPEAYMPTTDTYIEKEAMINEEIDRLRHKATSALISRKDVIVVASVSCIYNLGRPENYTDQALHLVVGQEMKRKELIRSLIKIQFVRNDNSLARGNFRARGDMFEIVPASGEKIANRVVIENDKIKSIEVIDRLTRKTIENVLDTIFFPPKHFVSNSEETERALKSIKIELKERLKFFKKKKLYLEAERLERRTRYDMEMIKSLGYCHGIENYSRHLTGSEPGTPPSTLLEYFPKKDGKPHFLTIMDESHIGVPQVGGMYAGDQSRKNTLIKYGWRLPSALDNRPLKFKEFVNRLDKVVFTSATPKDWELEKSSQVVEQIIRPTGLVDPPIEVRPVYDVKTEKNQIKDIVEEIHMRVAKNQRTIVNTLTKRQAEDLTDFLKSQKIKVNYIHSDVKTIERTEIMTEFRKGLFDVLVGVNLLREGLDFPEVALVAILDADREGFLRNETSLIQTMGRAARNVDGQVILYADKMTNSIKNAIYEVERRRKKQIAHNKKHGIIAKSIEKDIEDILEVKSKKADSKSQFN